MSRSKTETKRFRQACYINFTIEKKIPDPCGPEFGFTRIVACFIEKLIIEQNCRAGTARGYCDAINELFTRRNFPVPADFNDSQNVITTQLKALQGEEDIARQRAPLTDEIFVQLKKLADSSPQDSVYRVVFDWFCMNRLLGLRGSEYAQRTQNCIDVYEYASSNKVVKAFIPKDLIFYDKQGSAITSHGEHVYPSLGKVKVRFRIQKNRQNGQTITIVTDTAHTDIDAVHAAYRIFLRARRLGQSDEEPMGVFVNKQNQKKYLTLNLIKDVLQEAAKIVHPDWSAEEISRLSSHSGRVWALVFLSEANQKPDFIKARLRWLGDSYRLYLRDTAAINVQHNNALQEASDRIAALLGNNINVLPTVVPVDEQMGIIDDMD